MEELERLLVWMIIRAGTHKLHTVFSDAKRTGLDVWVMLDFKDLVGRANTAQHRKYGYMTPVWRTVVTAEDNRAIGSEDSLPRIQSAIGDVLV